MSMFTAVLLAIISFPLFLTIGGFFGVSIWFILLIISHFAVESQKKKSWKRKDMMNKWKFSLQCQMTIKIHVMNMNVHIAQKQLNTKQYYADIADMILPNTNKKIILTIMLP